MRCFILLLAVCSLGVHSLAVGRAVAADKVDFASDILPILETHCVACHNEDDNDGDLALDSHAALIKGGQSGLAITAGESKSSRLLLMVTGKLDPKMPPEEDDGLDEKELDPDEIATLAAWIDQGAIGPSGDLPIKRELHTPDITPQGDIDWPLTAVATSSDGKLHAIARYANVTVQDQNGETLCAIDTGHGKVNSLAFNRDGSQLLIGSGQTGNYGRAAIYSVIDGQLQTEIIDHRDVLYAAEFSPDETIIATAGYDRVIKLWRRSDAKQLRELKGHNGAVFDLAFSPDGKVLVSGCADETVKIWSVASGQRLDTLGQPEGEVFAVDVTPDGQFVVAGSGDNRLRVWRLRSVDKPRINPIVATRFVDESPIVALKIAPDGQSLVVLSQAGNVKVIRTSDWNQAAALEPLDDTGSDITIDPQSKQILIAMMNGKLVKRTIPASLKPQATSTRRLQPIYLDLGDRESLSESQLRQTVTKIENAPKANSKKSPNADVIPVGRGVTIDGVINQAGQVDRFSWHASAGEVWAIDADAAKNSPLDPIVKITDESGQPILKVRLQAVRDSYFTFRGKDSKQFNDFRVFNWQEMNLKQYFYAGGEVTRLWMHPRGPDSGFNVYPGEGIRWTYFGTTNTTHALGEPAYIVQPLASGQEPIANGLPVFDLYYENDDDPMRIAGTGSRVLFTAPRDGVFTACVTDTRGDGNDAMRYLLAIRPAKPSFVASVVPVNGALRPGTGREFTVRVDRIDGYMGPVTFDIPNLPPHIRSNTPLVIEAGQRYATGTLWVADDVKKWDEPIQPNVVAWANINGRKIERQVGTVGELTCGDPPDVVPSIQPIDRDTPADEDWVLQVRRGETVSARLVIKRKDKFNNEVSFGKELAGRNTSAGVYVDNIGLNGLIVLKNANERTFFLTADISAQSGKRSFFLTANVNGNVTSHPITVEVLP